MPSLLCSINFGNRELQYILKRSSRKTIGISIDKSGVVKVACPFYTSENYINQLLIKKSNWILDKLTFVENRYKENNISKIIKDGEAFCYLGKTYILKLIETTVRKSPIISLQGENILIEFSNFDEVKIKKALMLWYVEQFRQIALDRISQYSRSLNVNPQKITIKAQKTRWGSCSSKGNINLNWRLIMAPIQVIDYVVVHELCHLREMNHSNKFWQLVGNIIPDHKEKRNWLKANGEKLKLE